MITEAEIHLHPDKPNGITVTRPQVVIGHRLEPGDVLQETDVYSSSNGTWERCPCPGLSLGEGVAAVWVRPGELSQG